MRTPNDLVIPKLFLDKFKEKIRIKDWGQTQGLWPPDIRIIKGIDSRVIKGINTYAKSKDLSKNYDLVLAYTGKNAKVDLAKMGLEAQLPNIKKFRLIGIPVPDFKLKNFELILAQKR